MEIIEKNSSEKSMFDNDGRSRYKIFVNGKERISANDYGEPEDNSLGRDLNFVFSIVELMEEAYNAGKNGEEFTVNKEELEDD